MRPHILLLATFVLGLLILSWSTLVGATDYDSAVNAYERRDYYHAIRLFSVLAEQGDPSAQYMLGKMYATGEGGSKDYLKAYKWLFLAEAGGVQSAAPIRKRISKRMSYKKITQAQNLANEWQETRENSSPKNTDTDYREIKDIRLIKKVQKQLKEHGYYFGKVDGISGPGTQNAIMVYQHAQGVQKDGKITESLLELMGISSTTIGTSPAQSQSEELTTLKKELRTVIAKAKRRNSAEPWLIARLEKLIAHDIDPWPNIIFNESFQDIEYREGEAWRVNDGIFSLESGVGLVGVPDSSWGSRNSMDDLAISLLEILINQQQPSNFRQKMAQIERNQIFSDSFSLTVKTGPLQSTEGLLFSCSMKGASTVGYQFALHPDKGNHAKLFFISGDNVTEIFSQISPVNFTTNTDHTFVWTRNDSGAMVVTVDGQQLLSAQDNNIFQKSFDTLTVTHFGDRVIYQDIQLRDTSGNE